MFSELCGVSYLIKILSLTFRLNYVKLFQIMADVAQLVRALVCGTRCRGFKSRHSDHYKALLLQGFFYPIFKGR